MKTTQAKSNDSTPAHAANPFFQKNTGHSPFAEHRSGETPFFNLDSIQPKLNIGSPNDKYEQEADAMAEQVIQKKDSSTTLGNTTGIQRKCASCEEEKTVQKKCSSCGSELEIQRAPAVQRKCAACEQEEKLQKKEGEIEGAVAPETEAISQKLDASKGKGAPLQVATRREMEEQFSADFSQVRIHDNAEAVQMSEALGAQAFTHGADIYFNSNKYQPGTDEGRKLLAHELTHTIQQGKSPAVPNVQKAPAKAQEQIGDCFGEAQEGPGRARKVPIKRLLGRKPFQPAAMAWELTNFDIDEHFIKTEHLNYIRSVIRPEIEQTFLDYTDVILELRIIGEASTTASRKHNLILSARRANCVYQAISSTAIPSYAAIFPFNEQGERAAQYRRRVSGESQIDNVEDAAARKVMIVLDIGHDYKPEKLRPSKNNFVAKVTCFGPNSLLINIGNLENPEQPVYREFMWFKLPSMSDCGFEISNEAERLHPIFATDKLQLVTKDSDKEKSPSSFQGFTDLMVLGGAGFLMKLGEPSFFLHLEGQLNGLDCDPLSEAFHGFLIPLGPTKNGEVPSPPVVDDCYKRAEEEAKDDYWAKIACHSPNSFSINIANLGNPEQPVYREFIWTQLPSFDGCSFESFDHSVFPHKIEASLPLELGEAEADGAVSSFAGYAEITMIGGQPYFHKPAFLGMPAFKFKMHGKFNKPHCEENGTALGGFLMPLGPAKSGSFPSPTDSCRKEEGECSDENKEGAAKEYIAYMIRISGDPTATIKAIKKVAKAAILVDLVLNYFDLHELIGGTLVLLASKDAPTDIYRMFVFWGGGITGKGSGVIDGNVSVSDGAFTLSEPKQLQKSDAGLVTKKSDFSGTARLTIVGGTNKEILMINGDGFSKTINFKGVLCDEGSRRSLSGIFTPTFEASCRTIYRLPWFWRDCSAECDDKLLTSKFKKFNVKVGRATFTALPAVGKEITNRLGGCEFVSAFINIERAAGEGETAIHREFLFIGNSTGCPFTVGKSETEKEFIVGRQLAKEANKLAAFSDFIGGGHIGTDNTLKVIGKMPYWIDLPGVFEGDCEGKSILGLMVPISEAKCDEAPPPFHLTAKEVNDRARCNSFKEKNGGLVGSGIGMLASGVGQQILGEVSGPELKYPQYLGLLGQIGKTIPNGRFIGKTAEGTPVVSFIDFRVVELVFEGGKMLFKIEMLSTPCSFDSKGEVALISALGCAESFTLDTITPYGTAGGGGKKDDFRTRLEELAKRILEEAKKKVERDIDRIKHPKRIIEEFIEEGKKEFEKNIERLKNPKKTAEEFLDDAGEFIDDAEEFLDDAGEFIGDIDADEVFDELKGGAEDLKDKAEQLREEIVNGIL